MFNRKGGIVGSIEVMKVGDFEYRTVDGMLIFLVHGIDPSQFDPQQFRGLIDINDMDERLIRKEVENFKENDIIRQRCVHLLRNYFTGQKPAKAWVCRSRLYVGYEDR